VRGGDLGRREDLQNSLLRMGARVKLSEALAG
jgi:hypothetical protein